MRRLAIMGGSGHGKVIAEAALLSGWGDIIFYDDGWPRLTANSHWLIVGDTQSLLKSLSDVDAVIVAIGDNEIRQKKSMQFKQAGFALASIVHPTAVISKFSKIGDGCFVSAAAVVQADTHIEDFAIINTSALIEHDCVIGEASHIAPSAALAGGVIVGSCSWIGINACVREQVTIGNNVVVGAGSTVVKDVPSDVTVVGSPARTL